MREAQVQTDYTGTAESLELELTFELIPGGLTVDVLPIYQAEAVRQHDLSSKSASIQDCQELLDSINTWIQVATHGKWEFGDHLREQAHGSLIYMNEGRVRSLHYGSPFQIELLLPLLTPPSLAGLFYLAKRLYGIDLEFKAYREQRRVEYLEARATAAQLSADSLPNQALNGPRRWWLTGGAFRDPES